MPSVVSATTIGKSEVLRPSASTLRPDHTMWLRNTVSSRVQLALLLGVTVWKSEGSMYPHSMCFGSRFSVRQVPERSRFMRSHDSGLENTNITFTVNRGLWICYYRLQLIKRIWLRSIQTPTLCNPGQGFLIRGVQAQKLLFNERSMPPRCGIPHGLLKLVGSRWRLLPQSKKSKP